MFKNNALKLLTNYGGDSSDEEVPGPRVSTKRSFKDEEEVPQKRLERLPVPQQFISKEKIEHSDDPSLHDGRIRSFAHQRGNWATFVYIPFEATTGITELSSFIQQIIPECIGLKVSDDFHISLTKTVVLKYHWIPSFVKTIKDNIENYKKFFILFGTLKIYCNEERTRTFLGIQIRSGYDSLLKLVETLNGCLQEYELPPFYKDASFHMSIAWCVGDKRKELENFASQINNKLEELMQNHPQDNWYIFVEALICRTGNKLFQFVLN